MNRRDFIHLLNAAGITMISPLASRKAFAAEPNQLVVTVMASGGWDATMFCDPKGNKTIGDKGYINHFALSDIKSAAPGSPIKYAPILSGYADTGSFDTLFNTHYNKMLVLNGIKMTGSHGTGLQDAAAGSLVYPTIGAMVTASYGANLSNGFISFGGSGGGDDPFGVGAITRIGDINSIGLLSDSNSYQSHNVFNLIDQAKRRSADNLQAGLSLPSRRRMAGQLFNAMNSPASVKELVNYIPGTISDGMIGQAELISASFASGMSIAGNIKISPFDSHANNDDTQSVYLQEVAAAVNRLWEMAEQYGYEDRLVVIMLSEGGRGPFYNTEQGKDDIDQSSMVIMSKSISGNRVIQSTDELYEARALNPSTHQMDEAGEIITPRHIHHELRQLLSINSSLVEKFPLQGSGFNLLGV
jgi:hypothetical protein